MQATIQEQLRAALNKWEQEEAHPAPAPAPAPSFPTFPAVPFPITNNLNRTAFQEVKDNPGTRKQVTDRLIARGFKLGSVSAVLGHMLRQGVAQKDDEGIMHVTTSEYVPLKSSQAIKKLKKKAMAKKLREERRILVDVRNKKLLETVRVEKGEERPVSSSSAGLTALVPAPAPTPITPTTTPTPIPPEQFVMRMMETMTVLQARAVYDELKKLFGDAK